MSVKRAGGVAALLLMTIAMGAFAAQNGRKQPNTDICVAKTQAVLEQFDASGFTGDDAIQKAVNAAKSGQIIEILDEATYNGQVTIDGRADAPWGSKVVGGKNGITIRYVAPSGGTARPTIRYNDRTNTSPKNCQEAKRSGDTLGASSNFETNGALRIIRASGITIEGLIIDGGGGYVWGAAGVFDETSNCAGRGGCDGNACPLYHGNAAVAVVASGNVQIRDCELKNAHFGMYIKDRNTGGVFGNPDPADGDKTVPLSGFGKTGNHLFEYNKIGENDVGLFFESSWDLGSTVRYNLIYGNYARSSGISGAPGSDYDKATGAIGFKDTYLSPVAIYNNTFYDNNMNLIGFWQVGFQHLIFNNIFSKPHAYGQSGTISYMTIDHMFPQRMKHCVLAADGQAPSGPPYYNVRFNRFTDPQQTGNNGIQPGATISGSQGGNFPNGANIRWLETAALFKSTAPSNADFLVPDYSNTLVTDFIRNQGWVDIGIVNEDGTPADLGAIPENGKRPCSSPLIQKSRVRVSPLSVLSRGGTTATSTFYINEELGAITALTPKYVRWIFPIPDNTNSFGNITTNGKVVPPAAVQATTLNGTATVGINRGKTFSLPSTAIGDYGFIEAVFQGKDANGNSVTSDVGFLPYRKFDYSLKIEVLNAAGDAVTTVTAGEPYSLRVTASGVAAISEAAYSLLSDPAAFMYQDPAPANPLVSDKNVTFPKTYPSVYFTRANPSEVISASGVYMSGDNRLPILGTLNIEVKPGVPAQVAFLNPLPKSHGIPATISRGVPFEVRVEVQDKYGNAVDVAEPVTVRSLDIIKGNVGKSANGADITATAPASATGNSDPKTGIATVYAMVTNGNPREEFDLVATIAANPTGDTGRLRIGRSADRLVVFYADAGANGNTRPDPSVVIEENVGEWFKVTVKVAGAGDTLVTSRTGMFVLVDPSDPGLLLSATEGGAAETMFPLTKGIATFYVGANADVFGACLDVSALRTKSPTDVEESIVAGGRCDITFKKPSSSIMYAVVYGDGHGRPDSLLIYYAYGGAKLTDAEVKPNKVTLTWPTLSGGTVLTAEAAALTVRSDYILHVNLTGVANRPAGYTSITDRGLGLVKVYGGSGGADAVDEYFEVYDGIGPVIAKSGEAGGGNPIIIENLNPGVAPDTIIIRLSEQLRDVTGGALIGTGTMFYTTDPNPINEPGATGGDALTVFEVMFEDANTYKVVVAAIPGGLQPDYWVRLNASGTLTDRAAKTGDGYTHPDNKPRADNRWVKLEVIGVQPSVIDAWYTANSATGKVDYAYVKFDKAVDIYRWFVTGGGGFVKIGTNVGAKGGDSTAITAANMGFFSVAPSAPNVLVVDLREVYKSSQSAVRTSGDMPFTLSFAQTNGWGSSIAIARDRAAPVLAEVYLTLSETDKKTSADTLVVVYSEIPSPASLNLTKPIVIKMRGGECRPTLTNPAGAYASGNFYRVKYSVDGGIKDQCAALPDAGDYVSIDAKAGFSDNMTPPNIQDAADNLPRPLIRDNVSGGTNEVNFSVSVRNNPLRRGGSDRTEIDIVSNTGGLRITGSISVFDNRGNVVAERDIDAADAINWKWDGFDRKGRLVDAGSYFFKAVCNASVDGKQKVYTITRTIGVVSGENNLAVEAIADAPSGGFTAGSNPVARTSDKVGLFWDGGGIKSGELFVYDASGNFVKRIGVGGKAAGESGRRRIGEWDLTDVKGRAVADGSYVVMGAITAKDGKKKRVSAIVSVGK